MLRIAVVTGATRPWLVSNVAFSPPAPSATGITPPIDGDKHLSGGFR